LHFAGNAEQAFLNNFDDIVESSLPVQKVMDLFPDKETAEDSILGKISYCEERIKYYRDLIEGEEFLRDNEVSGMESVPLAGTDLETYLHEKKNSWEQCSKDIEEKYTIAEQADSPLVL